MIRAMSISAVVAVAGVLLVGCSDNVRWLDGESERAGTPQEAIRFDANGNKIYDPSVRTTKPMDMDRERQDSGMLDPKANWNNNPGSNNPNWSSTPSDERRAAADRRIWETWDSNGETSVREADLPAPVLTTFHREGGNGELRNVAWANYEGKKCYCTKVFRDGGTYKIISDADGNVLAMKRVD